MLACLHLRGCMCHDVCFQVREEAVEGGLEICCASPGTFKLWLKCHLFGCSVEPLHPLIESSLSLSAPTISLSCLICSMTLTVVEVCVHLFSSLFFCLYPLQYNLHEAKAFLSHSVLFLRCPSQYVAQSRYSRREGKAED